MILNPSIPFYKKKQKPKVGEGTSLKVPKTPIEFHELLSKFHKERVEYLKSLGWLINKFFIKKYNSLYLL